MSAGAKRWTGVAAAFLLVNLALSFHNVWPTLWITAHPELSVEAAAIVLLIVVAASRAPVSPWLVRALTILMLFLAAARYMEVTAPALYGRAINLYWDAQHLPAVAQMMFDGMSPWRIGAAVLAAGALLVGLYAAFRWALATLASAARTARPRRLLGSVAACLVGLYFLGYETSTGPILRWFSIPVTQTYVRQLEFVAEALAGSAGVDLPAADPLAQWSWPRAPRADVLVVFVESYGAVAYDAAEVAAELAPHRAGFEAAVAATNRGVVSGFVTSPTFGGVSWLAHASFMTGIDVTESGQYNVLLTQNRETLVDRFAAAGYRTLALMPGLRGEWPEGSFYGFDRILGERAIGYTGPAFGWWRVPDQFALARLDAAEIAIADRAPVLVFFPTINTHMPFRPTPPYQPDWDALAGPEPYPPELLGTLPSPPPALAELRAAYAGAVAYTYDTLAAYLRLRAERDYVLVVLGDHQPAASVAGQGARWDVPVHIIAREAAVLAPFVAAGFDEGMEPPPEAVGRTHELGALLLEALGASRAGR